MNLNAMVQAEQAGITVSRLPGLPLNVLLQVFCMLSPLDLLRLARTSKNLRGILMSRSSRFAWEAALADVVGLPLCPPDLSEPHYADLAFDPHCDLCLLPCVTNVYWPCRVRCCMDCLMKNFKTYAASDPYPYEDYIPCIPTVRGKLFRPSDIENFLTKKLSFGQDVDGELQFLESSKALTIEKNKHAEACRRWQDSVTFTHSGETNDARSRRRKAIIEKLESLGWADEIASMDEATNDMFTNLPGVSRQRNLNDRIWSTIKATVLEFMQSLRNKHNASTLANRLSERTGRISELRDKFVSTRPIDEPQPCLADFCCMPNIQPSIVMLPEPRFTEHIVNVLPHLLSELAESWRQYASEKLIRMMPHVDHVSSLDSRYHLELATTFFTCMRKCQDPIGYPRVLVHRCMTCVQDIPKLDDPNADFYHALIAVLDQQPWNLQGDLVSFNPQASSAAHVIVEAAGLDPYSTTSLAMNELDFWFICALCSTHEGQLAMSWDAAVAHSINAHEGTMKVMDWSIFNSVFPMTSADVLDMVSFFTPDYCCYKCGLHLSFEAIPPHMKEKHRLAYDDFHSPYDDCYRHLDASPPKPIRIQVPTFP